MRLNYINYICNEGFWIDAGEKAEWNSLQFCLSLKGFYLCPNRYEKANENWFSGRSTGYDQRSSLPVWRNTGSKTIRFSIGKQAEIYIPASSRNEAPNRRFKPLSNPKPVPIPV